MPASPPNRRPTVLLESFSAGCPPRSFRFTGLIDVITANQPDEVAPAFRRLEQAAAAGRYAAGFLTYEAARGLNPDLTVQPPGDLPLLWFGIFGERHPCTPDDESPDDRGCRIVSPETAPDQDAYGAALAAIRSAIGRGETYQVNFTTRQRFSFEGDPFALYRRICRNQQAPFCAWIDTGARCILSASPELFFSLKGGLLTMRPMKGTAPRLPSPEADGRRRERLAADPKERAENLMIVDLVRNDLGMIAETGTVEVSALFDVESYPTLHQMTSTVTARIRDGVGLTDIFRVLFPCGSVTGAPKRRTMEIIAGLEEGPRGVYCGAIGHVSPGGDALFSVAIRTVVLDISSRSGELGIGSGITWDSGPEAEYRECLAKAAFLHREPPDFHLIESIRHDPDGYLLLDRHIRRLASSAARLGFCLDEHGVRGRLDLLETELTGSTKVRLLLAPDGRVAIDSQPITEADCNATHATVAIASRRVDSSDLLRYHKTTRRTLFDEELRDHPGCYDVLFLNERGELAEGGYTNLVLLLRGRLLTPALSCGLLPGVLREELLEAGGISEAVLTMADLAAAEKIWLINSVRGWRECTMEEA